MRSIDQLKIDRIHKATMDIVYSEGFENISLRQIAQLAKVSSAAPYVYYKDKQDLLASLCCICLDYVGEGLQESITAKTDVKEKLYTFLSGIVEKFCDVPLMVKYAIKFRRHPDLFTEDLKERYAKMDCVLESLCKEAISSGQARISDPMLMQIMLLSPVTQLFDVYDGREDQFDPKIYEECIRLSVDAVM